MRTHADKKQDKTKSVAHEISQKRSNRESTFQFVDNRPESVAQRKLKEMANNSPQTKQAAQLQAMIDHHSAQQQHSIQKKENNTGLPDKLKAGIKNLSGYSMDNVKVHFNSNKPAQLQAHAYAQGTDIHLASGQEKHLPHEAWHVVQQKQGRVKPTMQMKGEVNINDDRGLEHEADVMGDKAAQLVSKNNSTLQLAAIPGAHVLQRNENEKHGLVPPTTHDRDQDYTTPSTAKDSKGHRHAVDRKNMTRFERMIDRVGRILSTNLNVHVAVALDDKTLVISCNKESAEEDKKLKNIVPKLKEVLNDEDPLSADQRVTGDRRTKDIAKIKGFLEDKYTSDSQGVEANDQVNEQLIRLKAAINGPVLDKKTYHTGQTGMYIVPTSTDESHSSYNMHGELKVSAAIRDRRLKGGHKEKDVYIGGTLADCFACNASHKLMNKQIGAQLSHNDWKFYSGGTHGGIFPNYKLSDVAKDHEQEFKTMTGTTVRGRDNPYVKDGTIDPEGGHSFNYDSDSDAEDLAELSAYSKARKAFKTAQEQAKKSRKQLTTIENDIKVKSDDLEKLEKELKALQAVDTDEEVKKALSAFEQTKKETDALYKQITDKKRALENFDTDLKQAATNVTEHHKVKLKYRKERLKSGIPVIFKGGEVLHDTMWTGETTEQNTLDELDVVKAYTKKYHEGQNLGSEIKEEEIALEKLEKEFLQLGTSLAHAQQVASRKTNLPDIIKQIGEEIANLKKDKEAQEVTVSKNEDALNSTKSERKAAALDQKVQRVKGKQDFLNQAAISHDESDAV